MICICQDYLGIQLRFEPFESNALDGALRTDRHENGSRDLGAARPQNPGPRFAVMRGHFPFDRFHTKKSTEKAKEESRKWNLKLSTYSLGCVEKYYFILLISDQMSGAPTAVSDTILPSAFTNTAEGVPNIPKRVAVL